MTELTPFSLKDAPALIEAVYPAQKISIEAQAERKAVQSQTLTGLGSYWKGRKPLILVRSIVLGSLLPQTDDAEKDLEIFEMLMGFDIESLAKRALIQNSIKPTDIAASISLHNPWDYFSHNLKITDPNFGDVSSIQFPIDSNAMGIKLRWNRDIDEQDKIDLLIRYLKAIDGYEEKANLGKRCEQIDPEWLYSHILNHVNRHYNK
jgi:putative DNA methylase